MSLISIDVGALVGQLLDALAKRPLRALIGLFLTFVFATTLAILVSAARLPASLTALFALLTFLVLGFYFADRDQVAAGSENPAGDPQGSRLSREQHQRYAKTLRDLNRETHRQWSQGKFTDPNTSEQLRDGALEGWLAVETSRLQMLGVGEPSILIVRREGDDYLVRRGRPTPRTSQTG
jgi:hypothetical protein